MGIQKFSLLQMVAKLDVATLEHLESLNLFEKGKWGKLPSMFQLNVKLVDVVLFQISWQNRTLDWNFPFPKKQCEDEYGVCPSTYVRNQMRGKFCRFCVCVAHLKWIVDS